MKRNARGSADKRDARAAARRFFDELLPAAVVRSPEKFLAQDGVISLSVPASGVWTIRFGSLDRPLVRGACADADLRAWFSPSAFAALVDGTLDVAGALRARQIRLAGDTRLLERLGFLFEVGGSPLNTFLAMRGG